MKKCPICNSLNLKLVYERNNIPTYQNVLLDSYEKAINAPKGNMRLLFCNDCTFLFNAAFDNNLVGYGVNYENDQTHSNTFTQHIDFVAKQILEKHQLKNNRILEIGCGNGYFLNKLILNNSNICVGFDKSLQMNIQKNQISLYNSYYEDNHDGNFDAVVTRHVVEHIIDNNDLLTQLVNKNPHAKYFIETPSLEWIIGNKAFFDIFYEHCSYFSAYSLHRLLKVNKLSVSDSYYVFNGQYLWVESEPFSARNEKSTKPISGAEDKRKLALFEITDFFSTMDKILSKYVLNILEASQKGDVFIWGAGAKGLTFANMIDPNNEIIDCLIDINPKKQNMFCAGTGHAIKSPDYLMSKQSPCKTIFIMNGNYHDEIIEKYSNHSTNYICMS